jgi:DnaK suppressor protein
MDHLEPDQLAKLRARLETEREQLNARLTEDAHVMATSSNAEPGDIEDAAAQEADQFRAQSMREHDRTRLVEVEAALARMDDGSYGICEETDEEIPFRRLELEPTARLTVAAQEQREREAAQRDPHADEPIGY